MRAGYQTTPDAASDIVTRTSYGPNGVILATEQPKTVAASPGTPAPADAGTRETVLYTAGANPRAAACGNKPAYADLVCLTRYAGAPSAGPALITTTTSEYDDYARPRTLVETSGAATRTTSTLYRADGQISTTSTSASGLTGSSAVPALTYAYSTTTGALLSTTPSTGQVISQTYDTWGRQLTYTSGAAETTTTAYDAAGRVKTVTDPSVAGGATTTYAYDTSETGSSGEEHRGLLTKLTVDNPGGRTVAITGAYDAAGRLVRQNLPGNVTQTTSFDTGDQLVGEGYTIGAGATPTLAWTQARDGLGRVVGEVTPDAGVVGADGYLRSYGYDRAGRLTKVVDHTALTANASVCVIRGYGFDRNGNRTSRTTTPSGTNGACQTGTPTGVTTTTSTYDSADRLTVASTGTGSYAYDPLGRVTSLPAGDSPQGRNSSAGAGAVSLGYYDTDAAASISQVVAGVTSQTAFGLDAAGRRSTSTTTTTPASGAASTASVVRHYTDGSDNPGWAATTSQVGGSAVTTTARYVSGLDGSLAATLHSGGADGGRGPACDLEPAWRHPDPDHVAGIG